MPKKRLGVNIDHIATLRQARRIDYPDPVAALPILKKLKVEQVTLHLREDRRHIQDDDLKRVIASRMLPVNLEMAATEAMMKIALKAKPKTVTLVPEKREEITTEGGLDCIRHFKILQKIIPRLQDKGIHVSLFIDPSPDQIDAAFFLDADAVELHTGTYCDSYKTPKAPKEWQRLNEAATLANQANLAVYAGHGLNTDNLGSVAKISLIEEYNIGHSLIARSVFVGLEKAVREIQAILR